MGRALPEKLLELPEDLAQIDVLLRDPKLFAPIEAHWDKEGRERGRSAKGHGRPTIPMQTFVRLLVLKHRFGWVQGWVGPVKVSDALREGF